MKFEEFDEIITSIKEHNDKSREIYKFGLDTLSFTEKLYCVIGTLLVEVFGKRAKDTIDWYLYDNVEHVITHTGDHKNGKGKFPIKNNKQLYDYITTFEKKK